MEVVYLKLISLCKQGSPEIVKAPQTGSNCFTCTQTRATFLDLNIFNDCYLCIVNDHIYGGPEVTLEINSLFHIYLFFQIWIYFHISSILGVMWKCMYFFFKKGNNNVIIKNKKMNTYEKMYKFLQFSYCWQIFIFV